MHLNTYNISDCLLGFEGWLSWRDLWCIADQPAHNSKWDFFLFFFLILVLCIILLHQKNKKSKFLLPCRNRQKKWIVVNPYSNSEWFVGQKTHPSRLVGVFCLFFKTFQRIIESVSKWTTVFSLPYESRSAYKLSEQCKRNCHHPFMLLRAVNSSFQATAGLTQAILLHLEYRSKTSD